MIDDIGPFLKRWPYDPESTFRFLCGDDGKRKLQVRTPVGIEQYELDGRPDGCRPYGAESFLQLWERRLAAYRARHQSETGFGIPAKACQHLCDELALYHLRYMALFHSGNFDATVADTAWALRCLDLLARYAEDKQAAYVASRYRPGIIHLNCASLGLSAVSRGDYDTALAEIRRGIRQIESLPEPESRGGQRNRRRALGGLRRLRREIRRDRPLTPRGDIRRQLRQAVEAEDYERAAELRDRLRRPAHERPTDEPDRRPSAESIS